MIEQRELITVCRQIGSMMEAGVDILRITRVLRAQTEDPETLRAFDTLDHALRMGQSLSDAMENVPTMFSPFAVSLVRQGEARNDIAGAWQKIADFLQKEGETDVAHENSTAQMQAATQIAASSTPPSIISAREPTWAIDDLIDRARAAAVKMLFLTTCLLFILALVWWSVGAGFIAQRWQNAVAFSVSALFVGGVGLWLHRIGIARGMKGRKTGENEAENVARVSPEGSTPPATTDPAMEARKVQGSAQELHQIEKTALRTKMPSSQEASFD